MSHHDNLDLAGSVVLVTGGTKGIGAGVAEAFVRSGSRVFVCGRTEPAGDTESPEFIRCDVRNADDVHAMFERIRATAGRLDVFINNAGGGPPAGLADSSPRLVERILQLNLLAPLLCAREANRLMQERASGGCIINICSVSGVRPSPMSATYGAAKAGLLHATESLAMEWGPAVRVNAVVCGFVATDQTDAHYGGREGVERIARMFPLKRFADPQDIASACLFFASPGARYVSGARLAVHGGGEPPAFLVLAGDAGGAAQ